VPGAALVTLPLLVASAGIEPAHGPVSETGALSTELRGNEFKPPNRSAGSPAKSSE
jgi:hypothetical protein